MEQSSGAVIFSVLYYASLFLLIMFLILVFIHFTIVPVFALTADNPGIIVISGAGDREVSYTDPTYTASSKNKRTPPGKTTNLPPCSYTIGFDIKSKAKIGKKTAILYRAAVQQSDPFSYTNFNTTNILVSTKENPDEITVEIFEDILDNNNRKITRPVAMRESISINSSWQRVCIVLADTFAEVYLNGTQVSTIVVSNLTPVSSNTDFFPPTNASVEISHMSMWPRILSPREIRYYESKPMNPIP